MPEIGKTLIFLGCILIVLGFVLLAVQKIPFIGRLPGDIAIHKKNFSFYFPLASSLILSILLSLIMRFFTKK